MPVAPVGAAAPALPAAAVAPQQSFAKTLEARAGPAPAAPPAREPARPTAGAAALAAVERAQARLDAVLTAARSGRTFTAQELLGLQAEAYRTVQTVDLAAKLVEQGAQAVKQALNTQL
ncbi:hypothetical protein [Anaeromyxobacter dehalogenans]|uniref:Uncharacterized protein n=1 Tax=Anaeromyxobacter dehalogenans (strain 2CP-C) TaxID=290397 RepID=Q2INV2_ANADE|nr:hypothetical protein [Anaeromyxobacter dehalogenans]ABC80483.1 hypothetical protein Adeh_0707 [Anaeromyxobacter dehalogenans 2CP-C]